MNIFKVLFLSIVSVGSALSAPKIWDGSVDESWYSDGAQAYNLITAEELAGLASLVNKGVTFEGKTITLGADIFLNDTTGAEDGSWDISNHTMWKPIGNSRRPFKGEFDGIAGSKRRKIYGLYINDTSTYSGLFGYTSAVSIKNLELIYANLNTKNYTGGLIGYASGGSVTNIACKVNIKGNERVGGVIGEASGTSISKISNVGTVFGYQYVGGLAGISNTEILGTENNFIFFEGNISGYQYVGGILGAGSAKYTYTKGPVLGLRDYVGGSISSGYYIGGITGDGTTTESYHILGDVEGVRYVGGLSGKGSCYNSFMKGNVLGDTYVGGLTGYGAVNSSYHSEGFVKGKGSFVGGIAGYSKYDIKNVKHSDGNVYGKDYVGGIVGSTDASISDAILMGSNIIATGSYVGGIAGSGQGKSIVNAEVYGQIEGVKYVGGIIGNTSTSSIKHVYSTRNVTGQSYVGGLAGSICNNQYYSDIKDIDSSFATGDVYGNDHVGGLAGSVCYAQNSYATGSVTGDSNYVGGVAGVVSSSAGYSSKNFNNVYSVGNVSGMDFVGGVAGQSSAYLVGTHAEGLVSGRNSVGGLVGYTTYGLRKSFATGDSVIGTFKVGGLVGEARAVIDSSYSTAHIRGDDNVGGLVGSAYSSVRSSYALGNVTGDIDNSSAGNDNIGGLVGYQYYSSIKNSFAKGNVSGTTKLGGLVGRFDGDSIYQSYATGSVTGSFYGDPEDEIGNYYIGGLAGYGKGLIEESYTTGSVAGIESQPVYTGCVVGFVSSSMNIKKTYYNKNSCALNIEGLNLDGDPGLATVSNETAKTTSEMQLATTFEDWNFTSIWNINEGETYPYFLLFANSLANAVIQTESLENIEYDGTEKTPEVSSVVLDNETLAQDIDYTVSYAGNIDAGSASIAVCGIGNYKECQYVKFRILPVARTISISNIDAVTYDGSGKEPAISVYEGETLISPSDYNISYENNVNAGTATVKVDLCGNYSGSASKTFVIEKAKPEIKTIPSASSIDLGMSLEKSTLSNGLADVEGSFAWVAPSTVPTLEVSQYSAYFIPEDTDNYENSDSFPVSIVVIEKKNVVVKIGTSTIKDTLVTKGDKFTLPSAKDSAGHTFQGWYLGEERLGAYGTKITVSENMEIEAIYQVISYNITFMNGSTTLQNTPFDYGTIPVCEETPTKIASAKYSYTFKSWNPVVVAVTGNATYKAVFDSTINKYTIYFIDGKDTLKSESYEYGALPSYGAQTPSRETTVSHVYKFAGWNPSISSVTGSREYKAVFDSTLRKYEAKFIVNGTVAQKDSVAYGKTPVYSSQTPSKASTSEYSYSFKSWSPAITAIASNVAYEAMFDSTKRSYTVTFTDNITTLQSSSVAYGVVPSYTGKIPAKTSTAKYDYTFVGWTPELQEVSGNAVYKAIFDSTLRKYEVSFVNGKDTLQKTEDDYGTLPSFTSDEPVKQENDKYSYKFKEWTPTVTTVKNAVVYKAVFDSLLKTYEIVFANGNDTLQRSLVAYGIQPAYTGVNPTKASSDKYDYKFSGWNKTISETIGNAIYEAKFDSSLRKFEIIFMNGSNKMQTLSVTYGTVPKYTGITPFKVSSGEYDYKFAGWSPEIKEAIENTTYIAVYDSATRTSILPVGSMTNVSIYSIPGSSAIQFDNMKIGTAYAILDIQGRIVKKGVVRQTSFMEVLKNRGTYIINFQSSSRIINIR